MKLLKSTKSKINKDKNSKNVLPLDITEVVFVHCNIVNNDYLIKKIQESCINLFVINHLVSY